MINKNIKLIVFSVFQFIQHASSQDTTGRIRFAVYPQAGNIKIDNAAMFNNSDTIFTLNGGSHNFKIWAPKMNLVDTNLTVKKDSLFVFRYVMTYNKNYIEYIRSLNRYKYKKLYKTVLPPLGILGISIAAFEFKKKSDDYHDQALEDIERYGYTMGGPDAFDKVKKDMEKHRKNYKLFKGISYGTASLAAVATFIYVLSLKKISHMEKPVYNETNLLSKIDLGFDYNVTESNVALNFSFRF
ncbi:MAG TPA: hypothetical protein VJY62_22875 [Bacteroidia bacterium]|nr:hypothetical protein [Bacteroidia bacterium]